MSLRRKRIILSSSSSTISLSMSCKVCLSIVSKADDMSIPVILISISSFLVLAASHLCAHATSAVLLSGLNPLWLWDRYSSVHGLILWRVMMDRAFLITLCDRKLRKTIGGLHQDTHWENPDPIFLCQEITIDPALIMENSPRVRDFLS